MIELTPGEWQTLDRLLATVLPSDGQAGAEEAGATCFLRRAFAAGRWAARRELLTSGLHTLDALARSRHGRPFAECDAADREGIVATLQRLPHPQSQRFLRIAIEMTLAGFLCLPRHGGNRDGIGWQVIGWQPVLPVEPREPA